MSIIVKPGNRVGLLISAILAGAITLPLCLLGAYASMALVHSDGGIALLLFWPVFPVMLLFGSGGLFAPVPEWLFNVLAVIAEFAGVFFIVHVVRICLAMRHRQ
ncbi:MULTISPECIES: hypothetical protein [Roseateles]|uniref:Uncharacterized protein n=1 Tax=Pelomonas aquatica TaxID=431058 RepID=A0ABU1ZE33_9BURK|nr:MULTISPECIES: hypothetical protein [Roseateles]MDR7298877.1 hypothetical protein [Pelomonas aquatica]